VNDLLSNDFLVISLGAIVGANARYLMSRYAARLLGPVFPYGTLIINILGSMIVGFFVIWTTERVLADPLAPAGSGGLLRLVHDVLQLRIRNRGVSRAGAMVADVHQLSQ